MNASQHASWQAEQLERLMAEQAGRRWEEHRCAMLSNPAAEREIDAIVLKELWPGVEKALQDSPLVALTGGGTSTPEQALETLHRKFTTRLLTFVIEDPERPADRRAWKPWFCRFEIVAWIEGYMLKKTTILSFPENFAMAKLTRLLQEPLMQGCPPVLSWYEGSDGPGMYSVEVSTGQGSDWGLRGQDGAREYVRKTVEDHLEVIAAMDRLAQNWDDGTAFNELHRLAAGSSAAC
ncbi:MAG: hypothetical protein OXK82_03515 [Deltaproteobacteria bacterium]|nr:hypothetical protein [Deltaproteobacteria bacterium]